MFNLTNIGGTEDFEEETPTTIVNRKMSPPKPKKVIVETSTKKSDVKPRESTRPLNPYEIMESQLMEEKNKQDTIKSYGEQLLQQR